jgi:signal transduction histidine kinase/ActR/RegA family two-component response regulator
VAKNISTPIVNITKAVKSIGEGDFTIKITAKTGGEIKELTNGINKMTEHLQKSYTALEEVRNNLEIKVQERTEELRRTHEQLLQSSKMSAIGTLSGGIAHDFNNLLFAILGSAELLSLELPSDSEESKLVKTIASSAQRGSELSKKLLTFARGTTLNKSCIKANDSVQEVVSLLKRTIEKMITIEIDLKPDLWTTEADPTQLYQVILNICVNAKDAMLPKGGGILRIETQNREIFKDDKHIYANAQTGKYVVISIHDNGVGMSRQIIEHIFEPFFTTKELSKGTGLGLAVSYGIIKSHNGFINVYSEKGMGSCFRVHLPACGEKIKNESPLKEEKILAYGDGTVLVVDDEVSIRELGKSIMERFGYTVLIAEDGKQALEIYQQQKDKINMVILDLIMPVLSGGETLKALKKINPNIKVLISSGYSSKMAIQEVIDIGVAGFLTKPFTIKELLDEVKRILSAQ